MSRETFTVPTPTGELAGWVRGEGPPVLILHGGPGLPCTYLDFVAADIGPGFRVAGFQQRGVAPSTLDGPFDMPTAIADVVAVMEHLGWEQTWLCGHSWGGHLALRVLASRPERLHGVLAVDPIGVAGDGGYAALQGELIGRLQPAASAAVVELDERRGRGEPPPDGSSRLRLIFPAYFADPARAPVPPPHDFAFEPFVTLGAATAQGLADVRARLGSIDLPVGYLAGQGSPLPWGQGSQASAHLSPGAW